MTRNLNGWQKLGVFISTLFAVLLLSSCQKSDVEGCVDAHMEAFDEETIKNPPKDPDKRHTRKEWRALMYGDCLATAAPKIRN